MDLFPTYSNSDAVSKCNRDAGRTSLKEYRHKMRSGDLPAYLSLNGISNGSLMLLMLFCSILALISFQAALHHVPSAIFVSFQSKYQKFNSCVTDGQTDQRTDGHTLL